MLKDLKHLKTKQGLKDGRGFIYFISVHRPSFGGISCFLLTSKTFYQPFKGLACCKHPDTPFEGLVCFSRLAYHIWMDEKPVQPVAVMCGDICPLAQRK